MSDPRRLLLSDYLRGSSNRGVLPSCLDILESENIITTLCDEQQEVITSVKISLPLMSKNYNISHPQELEALENSSKSDILNLQSHSITSLQQSDQDEAGDIVDSSAMNQTTKLICDMSKYAERGLNFIQHHGLGSNFQLSKQNQIRSVSEDSTSTFSQIPRLPFSSISEKQSRGTNMLNIAEKKSINSTKFLEITCQTEISVIPPPRFRLIYCSRGIDEIPSALLLEKPCLQHVDLSQNRLRFIPQSLSSHGQMRYMKIQGNYIKSIPEWLPSSLPRLMELHLSNNLISEFTSQIFLPFLMTLDLSHNRISELSGITHQNLPSLQVLRVQGNLTTHLPSSLSKVIDESLQELTIDWFKYCDPPRDITQRKTENDALRTLSRLLRSEEDRKKSSSSEFSLIVGPSGETQSREVRNSTRLGFLDFIVEFSKPSHRSALNQFSWITRRQLKRGGSSQLHQAAAEEDVGVLVSLCSAVEHLKNVLKLPANSFQNYINSVNEDGHTALSLSILEEKYFSAKKLLQIGANPDIGGGIFGSPLNIATMKGQRYLITDMLCSSIKSVNKGDSDGNTCLHYLSTVFSRETETSANICQSLLRAGANPNLKNREGWTYLHLAVRRSQYKAVQFAVEHNKRVRDGEAFGYLFDFKAKGGFDKSTVLHLSCLQNDIIMTRDLVVSEEIDFFAVNSDNLTALALPPRGNTLIKLMKGWQKQIIRKDFVESNKVIMKENYKEESCIENESEDKKSMLIQISTGIQDPIFDKSPKLIEDSPPQLLIFSTEESLQTLSSQQEVALEQEEFKYKNLSSMRINIPLLPFQFTKNHATSHQNTLSSTALNYNQFLQKSRVPPCSYANQSRATLDSIYTSKRLPTQQKQVYVNTKIQEIKDRLKQKQTGIQATLGITSASIAQSVRSLSISQKNQEFSKEVNVPIKSKMQAIHVSDKEYIPFDNRLRACTRAFQQKVSAKLISNFTVEDMEETIPSVADDETIQPNHLHTLEEENDIKQIQKSFNGNLSSHRMRESALSTFRAIQNTNLQDTHRVSFETIQKQQNKISIKSYIPFAGKPPRLSSNSVMKNGRNSRDMEQSIHIMTRVSDDSSTNTNINKAPVGISTSAYLRPASDLRRRVNSSDYVTKQIDCQGERVLLQQPSQEVTLCENILKLFIENVIEFSQGLLQYLENVSVSDQFKILTTLLSLFADFIICFREKSSRNHKVALLNDEGTAFFRKYLCDLSTKIHLPSLYFTSLMRFSEEGQELEKQPNQNYTPRNTQDFSSSNKSVLLSEIVLQTSMNRNKRSMSQPTVKTVTTVNSLHLNSQLNNTKHHFPPFIKEFIVSSRMKLALFDRCNLASKTFMPAQQEMEENNILAFEQFQHQACILVYGFSATTSLTQRQNSSQGVVKKRSQSNVEEYKSAPNYSIEKSIYPSFSQRATSTRQNFSNINTQNYRSQQNNSLQIRNDNVFYCRREVIGLIDRSCEPNQFEEDFINKANISNLTQGSDIQSATTRSRSRFEEMGPIVDIVYKLKQDIK